MSKDAEIVLVVDDTPQNIDILSNVLRSHFKVKATLSGQKALEIARKEPRPDIILLDIMMPEMDGFEVCRQLKGDPDTAAIPIVFITAMSDAEDETLGLELGAVDYISKPINPAVVLSRVRTHLHIAAQQRAIADKEALLRMALDNMPGAMWVVDSDFKLVMANDRYSEFYGDTNNIVKPGSSIEGILRQEAEAGLLGHDGNVSEIVEQRLESFRSNEETSFEDVSRDGRNVRLTRRPTEDGFVVSIATDITDLKDAERKIIESEQHIRSLLETSNEGVWMIDNDGATLEINKSLSEILDQTDEQVKGRYLYEFLDDPSKQVFLKQLERRKKGEATSYEVVIERPDGETVPVVINGTPMYDAAGTKIGSFGMVTDITEVKNKETQLREAFTIISESIQYASKIQRSVLPTDAEMSATFRDYFAIWEPKDVVGGDVYLLRPCDKGTLLMAADCTGHGVPGAFMSMIATGSLDLALIENPSGDPAALLGRINQLVKLTLGQEGRDGESDDGFECGLCLLDRSGNAMTYAGARFELWEVKNGEMTVIKGDKPGIGYRRTPMDQTYTNHGIDVSETAMYYLFSDGIIDQPGGPKHRAFGKRRLKSNLLDYYPMPLTQQVAHLMREFGEYQHKEERRDDVTLIGFMPRVTGGA